MPEQVPTAEGLTIRVINNVTKKCDVSTSPYLPCPNCSGPWHVKVEVRNSL
jgi:hypothetical protein